MVSGDRLEPSNHMVVQRLLREVLQKGLLFGWTRWVSVDRGQVGIIDMFLFCPSLMKGTNVFAVVRMDLLV